MTDRDLIGEKVISQHYGEGEIVNVYPEKVEIKFSSKTSQFIWKAFTMSLKAVRPEIQKYIEEKLIMVVSFTIGNHGIGCAPEEIRLSVGEILKLPASPQGEEDYQFDGWNDGTGNFPAGADYTVQQNVTFEARWRKKDLPVSNVSPRFYFVFQGSTYENELSDGFIFAPYSPSSRWIHHWERMSEVRRGDIIFHCVNTEVLAVSQALGSEHQIDMPRWAGQWRQYGPKARRIDVDVHEVIHPVSTKYYREKNKEYCRDEDYPPFNKNGTGNQGYLYNFPKRLVGLYLTVLVKKNAKLAEVPFVKSLLQRIEDDPDFHFNF